MKMIRRSIRRAAAGWTRPGAYALASWLAVLCVTLLLVGGCQQAPSAPAAQSQTAEKKEETKEKAASEKEEKKAEK